MISDNFKNLFKESLKASKSLSSAASKAAKAVIDNKQIISPKLDAQKRLDICNKCPSLDKSGGRCEECGCFVTVKVKLDFESCPLKKW